MAHKVCIDGTAYEIDGGKAMVDGTVYEIDHGTTLVDGTAYEVGFAVPVELNISCKREKSYRSSAGVVTVTVNGETYDLYELANLHGGGYTVPTIMVDIGTEVIVDVPKVGTASSFEVNGASVSLPCTYTFTIKGSTEIYAYHNYNSMIGGYIQATITEQ